MTQLYMNKELKLRLQQGMTLIELSIVLVVIGLIIGGVVVGASMRQNANLQSVIAEQGKIIEAIANYKERYEAIPGDHGSAESFFGVAPTDNGNDNGVINEPSASKESWLLWQHLQLAGLWTGTYTGTNGVGPTLPLYDAVIGKNVPASSFPGIGFSVYYVGPTADNNLGLTPQNHFLVVGRDNHTDNMTTFGGWASTGEAQVIDTKLDDGFANSGNVRTYIAQAGKNTTNCTTGVAPNHVYNTASSTALCNILFMFEP